MSHLSCKLDRCVGRAAWCYSSDLQEGEHTCTSSSFGLTYNGMLQGKGKGMLTRQLNVLRISTCGKSMSDQQQMSD